LIEEIKQISENEYEILSCIEWEHYKYPSSGISGNFVVGLARQVWEGQTTIWAATVSTGDAGEMQGLSYSRDDGNSPASPVLTVAAQMVVCPSHTCLASPTTKFPEIPLDGYL
jgi:hypothetical protein